jgi:flagellar biosynthesis/type III secretory pathway chaperone
LPENSTEFDFFLEALETFENLLHAETQAIAAKHLDTIEEIIERKDENLKALLEAKERIGVDPRSVSEADTLVDQVLDLQEKNVESFRRLFDKQFKLNQGKGDTEKPRERKLRKAYLTAGEGRLPELDC